MDNASVNVCTRCGKPRVIAKTWTEKVKTGYGTSVIRHVETVCPDPKCQKKVDEDLAVVHKKRMEIQENREKREAESKSRRIGIRL